MSRVLKKKIMSTEKRHTPICGAMSFSQFSGALLPCDRAEVDIRCQRFAEVAVGKRAFFGVAFVFDDADTEEAEFFQHQLVERRVVCGDDELSPSPLLVEE